MYFEDIYLLGGAVHAQENAWVNETDNWVDSCYWLFTVPWVSKLIMNSLHGPLNEIMKVTTTPTIIPHLFIGISNNRNEAIDPIIWYSMTKFCRTSLPKILLPLQKINYYWNNMAGNMTPSCDLLMSKYCSALPNILVQNIMYLLDIIFINFHWWLNCVSVQTNWASMVIGNKYLLIY